MILPKNFYLVKNKTVNVNSSGTFLIETNHLTPPNSINQVKKLLSNYNNNKKQKTINCYINLHTQ